MQHTKGPWTVGMRNGHNASMIFANDDNEAVCSVYDIALHTPLEDLKERDAKGLANARLIADAPDLLEALQNMMGLFDNAVYRRKLAEDTLYSESIATARAAIAKAIGEAG